MNGALMGETSTRRGTIEAGLEKMFVRFFNDRDTGRTGIGLPAFARKVNSPDGKIPAHVNHSTCLEVIVGSSEVSQ